MLITVKKTSPAALFFGFKGTPTHDENHVNNNTTADVFGNELHRYSIADGNVLGFDPYKTCTFKDKDLRQAIALEPHILSYALYGSSVVQLHLSTTVPIQSANYTPLS